MKFADLATRTTTAALLIGFIIAAEIFSEIPSGSYFGLSFQNLFPLLALLFIGICVYEYDSLCRGHTRLLQNRIMNGVVTFLPSLVLFIFHFYRPDLSLSQQASLIFALGVIGLFFGIAHIASAGRVSLEEASKRTVELLIGAVILGFGGASLLGFALLQSHFLLFWIIGIVAANDIGAYFIGKLFGKHKLSVFISPGKSIEGSIGGLLLGVIAGYLIPYFSNITIPVPILLSCLFIGMFGQLFDLTKSFIKRIANVKDSGTLLPGHGGFLDRMDGILGGSVGLQAILIFLSM
jgi:CDP-diglyceride synthetase